MTAYYNEFDAKAAAWLRELIKAGHIAPGDVDERSIVDIRPADLVGYTQCHFFAGIGVWSYALRRAGWPDDSPVWTGSCPCQPFSAAGKGDGFADERHLWPHFHWLIQNCRPAVVFGEQVASKDGLGWLDLVQADLEGSGYTSGAVDTCAAGFGAPHIRQRLYWVGQRMDDATGARHVRTFEKSESNSRDQTRLCLPSEGSRLGGVADAYCDEQRQGRDTRSKTGEGLWSELSGCSIDRGLAHADGIGAQCKSGDTPEASGLSETQCQSEHHADVSERSSPDHNRRRDLRSDGVSCVSSWPGPTNGLWSDADWVHCRDGKWRPVEPGTFPLANGAAARVGRLRGYGNAIVATAAQAFIEAYLETELVAANDNNPYAKAA
ncbi:DNA cytosine methyltransferase [Brucella sp. NBRC 12953]|uniref:DNA cytosine methyltransferase n=1 Tax=Brucella sp. NBRC 12953 TaxID=3075481 RepID=UPI00333F7690